MDKEESAWLRGCNDRGREKVKLSGSCLDFIFPPTRKIQYKGLYESEEVRAQDKQESSCRAGSILNEEKGLSKRHRWKVWRGW